MKHMYRESGFDEGSEISNTQRKKCVSCGHMIHQQSHLDPYLCSECEDMLIGEEPGYASF